MSQHNSTQTGKPLTHTSSTSVSVSGPGSESSSAFTALSSSSSSSSLKSPSPVPPSSSSPLPLLGSSSSPPPTSAGGTVRPHSLRVTVGRSGERISAALSFFKPSSSSPSTQIAVRSIGSQTDIALDRPTALNEDADHIPHALRPRLTGYSKVMVRHMYDQQKNPPFEMEFSNDDLQFDFQPKYVSRPPPSTAASAAAAAANSTANSSSSAPSSAPSSASSSSSPSSLSDKIIYYDAQDPQWYKQILPNPVMSIWILIKYTNFKNSGYTKRRLVEEAIKRNVQVRLMNPNRFDLAVTQQGANSIVYEGEVLKLPDVCIPRVGANVDYFGLAVMRQLEGLGVKVFNPTSSIEISRDKLYTHQVLAVQGLPIPKTILSRVPVEFDYIEEQLKYPIVLKLTSGSRGEAVWRLSNRAELIQLLRSLDVNNKPMIFQDYLSHTKGRDVRCLVVGGKLVAAIMRVPTGWKADERAAQLNSATTTHAVKPVKIKEPLAELTVEAAKLTQLDITTVDLLMDKTSYKLCELNSSPGIEELEKATGINCAGAIIQHCLDWFLASKQEEKKVNKAEPFLCPVQYEHTAQYFEEHQNETATACLPNTAAND